MKRFTEYTIWITMIVAGLAWMIGLDIVYTVSACVMAITGMFYWFRYIIPDLFKEKDSEFLDN